MRRRKKRKRKHEKGTRKEVKTKKRGKKGKKKNKYKKTKGTRAPVPHPPQLVPGVVVQVEVDHHLLGAVHVAVVARELRAEEFGHVLNLEQESILSILKPYYQK